MSNKGIGLEHGSNPCRTANLSPKSGDFQNHRTDSAQETGESEAKVKFPKVVRHRKAEVTIYGKKPNYPFYRLAWRIHGKRRMKSFKTYSEAKGEADELVKDLAKGSAVAELTPDQARDAIAAIERLEAYHAATGKRIGLLAAVSEFADTSEKVNGWGLRPAVEGFLKNVADVKRKDLAEAVEEFVKLRKEKTVPKDGKRAQLSKGYAGLVASWLRDFAKTFPATAVNELTREHLTLYFDAQNKKSPKSRNHYRGAVKMFLSWSAKRDYLSQTHRLLEADCMAVESADLHDIAFFKPAELQSLLNTANENPEHRPLLPIIVLGGLAGIRLQEILRLDWADVWSVEGHVEIGAKKAKTRSRRLVELCAAARAWLEPYRNFEGKVCDWHRDTFHVAFNELRKSAEVPARRNGLRHAFCTFHFAAHANENLTAQQAGNSPTMIHQHYKGLATKADAEKWFNTMPPKVAENIVQLPTAKAVVNL